MSISPNNFLDFIDFSHLDIRDWDTERGAPWEVKKIRLSLIYTRTDFSAFLT